MARGAGFGSGCRGSRSRRRSNYARRHTLILGCGLAPDWRLSQRTLSFGLTRRRRGTSGSNSIRRMPRTLRRSTASTRRSTSARQPFRSRDPGQARFIKANATHRARRPSERRCRILSTAVQLSARPLRVCPQLSAPMPRSSRRPVRRGRAVASGTWLGERRIVARTVSRIRR